MDLDTLLLKWNESKQQLAELTKEVNRYKGAIERYMDRKNKNIIKGKEFTVSRRNNTRRQLSKSTIPHDLWEKYSTKHHYTSYHLKRR